MTRFFDDPAAAFRAWREDETQTILEDEFQTRWAVGHWPMVGADVDQDLQWWEVDEDFVLRWGDDLDDEAMQP